MQSEQHVRRLVRELDLPEQADQVIQRPKYWTPAFCWFYFERCDELVFDDAHAGLQAAEVAPELVALVGKFSRDREPLGPLLLRALAILGSAYRAVGNLERSAEIYAEAFRLMERKPVAAADRANVLFRVGILRSFQNRLDEALELANGSVAIYRESSAAIRRQYLGEALTVRGLLHQFSGRAAPAVKDWSEALCCTDPKTRPRIHHAASHNLATSLVENAVDSRSLSRVESYLRQARRFLSKRPRSVQKLRLIWLQGMIMIRFGSTRRGEALFAAARRGFIEMQAPFDMALVSVDLGRCLFLSQQLTQLKALAVETVPLFRALCGDRQANQALAVWREAVLGMTVSAQAFATAWQTVQQRAVAISGSAYKLV